MAFMDFLKHYGTPRHSGRYPWGSGERPRRNRDFLSSVRDMKKKGMTEKEIAEAFEMNTKELRAHIHIANNQVRKENYDQARKLKEKGYSNQAIADRMGLPNESSVRSLLDESRAERANLTQMTVDKLKLEVDKKGWIDVGRGTEQELGIKATRLDNSLAVLKEEGYEVITIQTPQYVTGRKTYVRVLAPPGTTYKDIVTNPEKIKTVTNYEELVNESGQPKRAGLGLDRYPTSISSDRVQIAYAEDGGRLKDGVIELRRGVEDISLGSAQYAQVRIAVDDTHYMKGMAMYADDLPEGIDIRYNTNKSVGAPKEKVFKAMKIEPIEGPNGEKLTDTNDLLKAGYSKKEIIEAIDKDNWGTWSKTLASQFLSKQPTQLAKKQLDLSYADKTAEFEEILAVDNPVIKKRLLDSFASDCDASAVHLKAAALPRQASKVILPIPNMKETEIYAPTYENGEEVILVRYPHGGIFEIPRLTVNNKQKDATKVMENAVDAVGINPKVAVQLSGADFDGDTVLVIPTKNIKVRTRNYEQELIDFDPQREYAGYEGMKVISNRTKQIEMGKVSNLITDMTLQGAESDEVVRAVKHSMVVIDSEKHELDYKRSAIENDIVALKKKYQGVNPDTGQPKGAATIISRAKSQQRVPERKDPGTSVNRTNTDPETGERIIRETGRSWVNKKGETVYAETMSTKMAEAKDAYSLTSGGSKENPGTQMEALYADYANKMKALANDARKESLVTGNIQYNPSAAKTYSDEVDSLNAKLNVALKNAPRERQALILANQIYSSKVENNETLDDDTKSRLRGQAITTARSRMGAHRETVTFTDREWEAIQAGAISTNKLSQIIQNADLDALKERATPRKTNALTTGQVGRIKAMSNSGYSIDEIAKAIGVSTSTVSKAIKQ